MGKREKNQQDDSSVWSAASPGPARIWRKSGKDTQGEPASRRREEGGGRHHPLTSESYEQLNASGNYQWAMGCPTLQKGQALGEFIAMLEASFLIPPYFSMCDSPKGPSTPPSNTWAFPVQGRKYINFRFHIWGVLAKSWVPRQFQSCAVSSLPRHPTSQ